MQRYPRRIRRDYNRAFFNKRKNYGRLYFIVFMILVIAAVPIFAYFNYSNLQLMTLDALNIAPTPTPFAAERAERGEAFYQTGDVETALVQFEQAVQQQPENINYLYEYGVALIELDRNDEATIVADRMLALEPNDPRGYSLKANSIVWSDPAAAIPIALQGREVAGDNQYAPIHATLSIGYTLIGRFDEALQEGELATRVDPMDAGAHRSYHYPLLFTGNYTEAINQLQRAIAINPNLTAPYFELASLYRAPAINRPEMAVSIYNEVLRIEPNNERAYARLCQTYAAVGLFQEAEGYCDEAIFIEPDYALAHQVRGQLRYSRRNYEGAIEEFQTCIRLDLGLSDNTEIDLASFEPDDVAIECLYIHGLAHYFLNQCDLAWELLNMALNHPGSIENVRLQILQGLENITINCVGYQGRGLPTPVPPTPIPPTPIGGF